MLVAKLDMTAMARRRPFVFFDLGQTLIDEWDFIDHFDAVFLEVLNGFGARIDSKNYRSIRDSVIRDRKIGHGSVMDLVVQVARMVSPPGYEKAVASRIKPMIAEGRSRYFRFADDAPETLHALETMQVEMGLIANQALDVLELLERSGLAKCFSVKVISSAVGLAKPDLTVFELALREAGREAADCIMVGDRLDTDICPAKTLGMTTIRHTNSLFSLQEPQRDCEKASYSVARLSEIPAVLERIISG